MAETAYVLKTGQPDSRRDDIAAGRLPRQDFDEFPKEGRAELVDLGFRADGRSLTAKVAVQLRLIRSVLQLTHGSGQRFRQFVTTGEDIGIPFALAMFSSLDERPLHIIFHGHYLEGRKFRIAVGLLRGRRNLHWHPLAASLGERLIAEFGVAADRVHVTGYAVDTEFYRVNNGKPTSIAAAGLAHRDYPTLIQAVRDLDVPVRIAAASSWITGSTGIESGSVPTHIEVSSAGDYVGLRDVYESGFFVVVPMQDVTHACGYAVIAEAMASGKAVIATRTRAPSDFIIEGETGFLVPPHDVDALRDRIMTLVRNPELAKQLGTNARRLMEARYSLGNFCARLQAAIDEAA